MNHDMVRRSLSASLDGEALSARTQAHLDGCPDCTVFAQELDRLRMVASRLADYPYQVPDVTSRVIARLPHRRPGRRRWSLATGFALGALIGAVVAGGVGGPRASFAVELPEAVVAAQFAVDRLSSSFTITESIAPDTRRTYQGTLQYQSPETLIINVAQTEGPAGWPPNSWSIAIHGETAVMSTPFPCPTLGGCADGNPRTRVTTGRDPFSAIAPAPLDAVVPTSILRNGPEPQRFEGGTIIGRPTAAFSVSAAQARPLLEAYFGVGNWREIHPTDTVDIWLDHESYVPLRLAVTPAESPDRALWAARRGYIDDAGTPYLVVEYSDVDLTSQEPVRLDPVDDDAAVDAGFTKVSGMAAPAEPDMPLVAAGRVEGVAGTMVWAWSDGRAWVRLDLTTAWEGPGLFGNDGAGVRPFGSSNGPIFESGGGDKMFVHGEGFDAAISGSVESSVMERLAEELPGTKLTLPGDWPEAPAPPGVADEAWLPLGLDGYSAPIVRTAGEVLLVDLFAAGGRSVHITFQPASPLSPPLDPDARAVEVRGSTGRYSPMLGLLEWTEGTRSVSIGSTSASLDELLAIASSLVDPQGGGR